MFGACEELRQLVCLVAEELDEVPEQWVVRELGSRVRALRVGRRGRRERRSRRRDVQAEAEAQAVCWGDSVRERQRRRRALRRLHRLHVRVHQVLDERPLLVALDVAQREHSQQVLRAEQRLADRLDVAILTLCATNEFSIDRSLSHIIMQINVEFVLHISL